MTDIPAGYQLSVRTYEGDADNYRTATIPGLTQEDVKFYIHFLNFFRSAYSYDGETKYYGNRDIDEYPEAYYTAVQSAYEYCPPSSPELLEDIQEYKENPDWCWDWACDLIGSWNEHSNYRVFDSFKVHLIESPARDLTQVFSPNPEQ